MACERTVSDEVGARIREGRKALDLTMADLGELAGLSRGVISDIENGRAGSGRKGRRAVTVDELVAISRALGYAPAALLPAVTSTSVPANRAAQLEAELRRLRRGLRALLDGEAG